METQRNIMEVDFIHHEEELIISKVIFTETRVYCTNVFPDRSLEKVNYSNRPAISALRESLRGRSSNIISNTVSISGQININSIISLAYSSMIDQFNLRLQDSDGNSLFIFLSRNVSLFAKQLEDVFKYLNALALPVLVNSILQNLSNEKPTTIGNIDLLVNGIRLDWNRIFKWDKALVPWHQLTYTIQNNNIIIRENNSSFIKSECRTSDENVCLLPQIIEVMRKRIAYL